jgi:rhodanese-related sulfurtransferase
MRRCAANNGRRSRDGGILLRQMLAILVASVALGWLYNKTSPLGIRAPKPERGGAPAAGTNASSAARPAAASAASANPASPDAPPEAAAASALVPSAPAGAGLRWVEVKPLLEAGAIVLVDARAKTAFEVEHIPGAVSLPSNASPEEFMAFAMKYPQSTAIVVYCGGADCDLSRQLAEKLRTDLGYTNVREMPGGIVEWRVAEAGAASAAGR